MAQVGAEVHLRGMGAGEEVPMHRLHLRPYALVVIALALLLLLLAWPAKG